MMEDYGHGWGMGWWWIIGFIILVVAIWIIIKVIKQAGKPSERSSLEILKKRYAKGEIDKAEFEERKRDLM